MAITRAGPQSALIVEVPEAEPAVMRLQARLDASAALGIQAHFTVLFPFMPPGTIDPAVFTELVHLFGKVSRFPSGWTARTGSAARCCGSLLRRDLAGDGNDMIATTMP